MNSTLPKIILGNMFRTGLTALIVFFVTKNVIEADVASKLMRGDTLYLYGGSLPINLTMVVNILVGLAIPIVLPLLLGIWSRLKGAYETLVARSEAFAMTKKELKTQVAVASPLDIIKAVATGTPELKI